MVERGRHRCGYKGRALLVLAVLMAVAGFESKATTLLSSQAQAAAGPPTDQAAAAIGAHAKGDISGNWQGTLQLPQRSLRLILQVTKADKGWAAKLYNIDQPSPPISVTSISADGSIVKYTVELMGLNYEGKLSGDESSIVGTWTQANPIPLTFVRATKETAWEIPAPPPPLKLMAADANPSFEVATIKPNDTATSMQGLTMNGRNFRTRGSSLLDLISFSYGVQAKQVVGGPDWLDKDRYDVSGVPDVDGAPNTDQLRSMVRKLLADRFKLTSHKEQRDLSAYVLTVAKSGQKLKPTELNGPLPGLGFRPVPGGLTLNMVNGTMDDLTSFMQIIVLDRPVVNRTDISGKYDMVVKFTPDDTQFHGHPPRLPGGGASGTSGSTAGTASGAGAGTTAATVPDTTETFPDLYQAFQQQVGLKLQAEKTAVDVIVLDHAEKPSAN